MPGSSPFHHSGTAEGQAGAPATGAEAADGMPTDRLLDVTPQALRMSSPFNAAYWMSAA